MAHVLIVDDDLDVARAWRAALEWAGHAVLLAHNGDDAVAQLKEATFDVVITDMIMPKGGGLLVSGMARLAPGAPKVIVVSGHLNEDLGGRTKRAFLENMGVAQILRKPVDLLDLTGAVDDALRAPA